MIDLLWVKGYKCLDKNMKAVFGNNMQYEIGKTYYLNEKIECGRSGFHFSKTLDYALYRYGDADSIRVFEIRANILNIKHEDDKYYTDKIKIVRELSRAELEEHYLENENKSDFLYNCLNEACITMGIGIDKYKNKVKYAPYSIQKKLAYKGYFMDELLHINNNMIRYLLVKNEYEINTIMKFSDNSYLVKEEIIRYAIINDRKDIVAYYLSHIDYDVKCILIENGYDLKRFLKDNDDGIKYLATNYVMYYQ